jgi:hypothetical protein
MYVCAVCVCVGMRVERSYLLISQLLDVLFVLDFTEVLLNLVINFTAHKSFPLL